MIKSLWISSVAEIVPGMYELLLLLLANHEVVHKIIILYKLKIYAILYTNKAPKNYSQICTLCVWSLLVLCAMKILHLLE